MPEAERVLWLSVIYVGLQDAARGQDPHWLYSDDFKTVCALAQVDAFFVRLAFRERQEEFKRPSYRRA
ncbi:hypothetical protein [Tranquillimonas alkanivorans]|uniref:Uncharacterized protein n=1 Tax=Tranquillimonas alkanivorans TaxID=441119 RepID=A0A1I5PLU5_9RHOB|nr:hypothetical protein [Tranquillimonas alkanivorans]SFP35029.1 hypothetical protein SAMN04488047_105164 [Tranquillimonas alkanivorans]